MSKEPPQLLPEYKQETVDPLRRSTKSQTQVARELGIAQTTLSPWALQADRMPLGAKGFPAIDELKVRRREVERMWQKRGILKKAVIFFAKESE